MPPAAKLPAACADCLTTTQLAQPGTVAMQMPSRVFRSIDGKYRVDSGITSVITDPTKGRTILLDHAKKQFQVIPMQPPEAPQLPNVPGLQIPQMPGVAKPPQVDVKELGKRFIEGHETEGKQYIIRHLQPPQAPNMPQLPEPPTIAEIWTSTSLQIPVLTRIQGKFGEQLCHCRNLIGGEPSPAAFEIPQDYKPTDPPQIPDAAKLKELTKPPQISDVVQTPAAPAPNMPNMPSAPQMPNIAGAPQAPKAPEIPKAPGLPKFPGR